MEKKSFRKIETVDADMLDAVERYNGRPPDNFVDSAEGALSGMPDMYQDHAARELSERLDAGIAEMIKEGKEAKEEGQ